MLQIIKKDGLDGYEKVISDLGLSGNPNIRVSEAVNGDEINGFGVYELSADALTIYIISHGSDLMLADGILRSILFLAAVKGVEKAVFERGSEDIAKRLGIIKSGTVLEPVSEVFGGCEDCKSAKD